jgi:hypothetical protein
VAGLDTLLCLALAAATLVGPTLLETIGISYVGQGGSLAGKLHPSTYLLALAFGWLLIVQSRTDRFISDLWARCRPELFFLLCVVVVAMLGVMRHGTGSLAYLIDAFIAPTLLALSMGYATPQGRARLFGFMMAALTLNSVIALAEYAMHQNLLGTLYWSGAEFRATALLGHPLANALITVPVVIFAFRLTASWLGHMPVLCLCSLALLAYGGRAAAVMAGVAIVMLMITDMVASLARGIMPVHRLLFFLAFMLAGPLALSAALGTTNLGARITDRFFLDQSAQSRFESIDILSLISEDQLWYGAGGVQLMERLETLGTIGVIEYFWIYMIATMGIYSFTIFLAGFAIFLLKLLRQSDRFGRIAILIFMAVASTNNSLASKSVALTVLTALVMGYGDYVRLKMEAHAARQTLRPRPLVETMARSPTGPGMRQGDQGRRA